MKNSVSNFAFFLLIVLFSGCSKELHTAYDHTVDFSKYKSFCWMDGCEFRITGPAYLNDEKIRNYVKKAIIENLSSKGLVNDENNPDLLIDFHISLEEETSTVYHHLENEQFFYKPLDEQQVIHFLKGTFVIHMVDKKESRMVWRSHVMGYLNERPDLSYENIHKGIRKALKGYPPKVLGK